MNINEIYNNTYSLLEKNLNLRQQKHNLIASNIANMDTPHYKPFNLIIEKAFDNYTTDEKQIRMKSTRDLHFKNNNPISRNQQACIEEEENVDIDKAMSDLSENTLLFNASAQILSKKYQMIKESIMGGKS